jgi:hypothetical protein
MKQIRTAAFGLLLAACPLFGGSGKECLDLAVTKDHEVSSPSGVRVTITGRNRCSEDLDGSRSRFKVTALGTGGAEIATQSGRFGGTVAAHGQVETKVFLVCDPDRVRSLRVEAQ